MIKASCGCGAEFKIISSGGASYAGTRESDAFKDWLEGHKCVVPFVLRYNSRTRTNRKTKVSDHRG